MVTDNPTTSMPNPMTFVPTIYNLTGTPSSNNTTVIIAGSVAGVVMVAIALFLVWKWRMSLSRRGEEDPLIQHEDGQVLPTQAPNGGSMDQTTWKYGELDPAGVKRVLQWIQEVRNATTSSGIAPIEEEEIVDSGLLGQMDDIGSPPQGYSPRVSNIGSDDGRTMFRDENQRGNYRDPL